MMHVLSVAYVARLRRQVDIESRKRSAGRLPGRILIELKNFDDVSHYIKQDVPVRNRGTRRIGD
jgi:hypothetical protein